MVEQNPVLWRNIVSLLKKDNFPIRNIQKIKGYKTG